MILAEPNVALPLPYNVVVRALDGDVEVAVVDGMTTMSFVGKPEHEVFHCPFTVQRQMGRFATYWLADRREGRQARPLCRVPDG